MSISKITDMISDITLSTQKYIWQIFIYTIYLEILSQASFLLLSSSKIDCVVLAPFLTPSHQISISVNEIKTELHISITCIYNI